MILFLEKKGSPKKLGIFEMLFLNINYLLIFNCYNLFGLDYLWVS
jgi:hypothetical protein